MYGMPWWVACSDHLHVLTWPHATSTHAVVRASGAGGARVPYLLDRQVTATI